MSYTTEISEITKKLIEEKDDISILADFMVILNTNRDFRVPQVDNYIKYLREYYPEFIKPNRNEIFKEDKKDEYGKDNWNEDYWTEIAVSLHDYFSIEKIEFLKEMSKKLYPIESITKEKIENNNEENIESKKQIPALLMVAIAVAAVAGIVIAIMKLNQ